MSEKLHSVLYNDIVFEVAGSHLQRINASWKEYTPRNTKYHIMNNKMTFHLSGIYISALLMELCNDVNLRSNC